MPDQITDEQVHEIRNRVSALDAAGVNARLLDLAVHERPTQAQRAEQRMLTEARAWNEAGQSAITAYNRGDRGMFDGNLPQAPNVSPGMPPSGHGGFVTAQGPGRDIQAHRTAALRTLDHYRGSGVLDSAAADRADKVLRRGDSQAMTARYLAAAGNEAYGSAFGKMLADPVMGHLRFSPAEVEAVREASAVQDAHRIMGAALTTGSTGFILPITWDPSILITGSGALNPVRDLADVVNVGTHDWEGVTADSVTAGYVQEGTEATDATPTLLGPKISTQQGRAFTQFTIEASQDWDTLSAQLMKLVADARNTVDASMFLTGTGTNQPSGILNIGGTNGLTTTQRVQSATVATYAVGDPWLLKAAIPARFIGDSTFAAAPSTWDTTYQFVAQGSTTQARQFADGDRGGDFLGRPKVEWSTMGTGATTGTKLIVAGNFKGYKIVDRLGMSAEILPHMLGATRLPLGVRGLYCYWRTGAGVISPNHFRYLEVK